MLKTSNGIFVQSSQIPEDYRPSPCYQTTHVWNPFVNWRRYVIRMAAKNKIESPWSKNKVKKGGLNHLSGQESALREAKKLINS